MDECLESLAFGGVAAHDVGVDAQGELGVGVAELGHDRGGVLAAGDEDRGEGVAQLVRRHALGQRCLPAPLEELVGAVDGGGEDAVAQVVLVAGAAGAGGEDEVVGAGAVGAGLVGGELVAQDRQQGDLAQAGLGLGAADVDAAVGEVDVAPEQVAELVRAGAGEDERGDDRAAVVGAPVGGAVHLGAGVEQADDLLGGVEVHGPARRELEPAAPPGGRVGRRGARTRRPWRGSIAGPRSSC